MKPRKWISKHVGDEYRLYLDGYPIYIVDRGGDTPFCIIREDRPPTRWWALANAKWDGERMADELDEMLGLSSEQGEPS